MKLGEEYRVTPAAAIPDLRNHRNPMVGKVVWVHPKGRLVTLEFQGVNGTFRESFSPEELTENNRVHRKRK